MQEAGAPELPFGVDEAGCVPLTLALSGLAATDEEH